MHEGLLLCIRSVKKPPLAHKSLLIEVNEFLDSEEYKGKQKAHKQALHLPNIGKEVFLEGDWSIAKIG